MLQNQSVRNLQYDSDIRIVQQPRPEPIVHDEHISITSLRRNSGGISQTHRIPLPVATVDGTLNGPRRTFIPLSGLEILHDMPSVYIEQTFELNDTLSSIGSDNRYTVRSPFGDALYLASEISTEKHRTIWGAARPFRLRLLDKTHQEVLSFQKDFALGSICCQPRALEVWMPPGDILGHIVEESSMFSSKFRIQNDNGEVLFRVEGISAIGCCAPQEAHFNIFSPDLQVLKGSITRKWSATVSQYTTNVYYNEVNLAAKSKALFLGAAFLMEYLYFQSK